MRNELFVNVTPRETRVGVRESDQIVELHIERALYSQYKPRGEPDAFPPKYLKWSCS